MTKKFSLLMLLGAGLLLTGAVLLVCIIRYRAVTMVSSPAALSVSRVVAASQPVSDPTNGVVTGMPNRLVIPSLNLDLPVIPGYYDSATRQWTLTKTNVQFATPTVQPNNVAGNTLIYGHALSNLFGSLPHLQSGAVAIVHTDNGHAFFYTLTSTQVVDPSNSAAVLHYTGKPILTLQTCVGLLYQNRELLRFDFQRYA